MKKKLLALAVPALFASIGAHAQSSVTLYGLIDEGFDFTSNAAGHRGYEMVSGDTVGSRWGLKGTEDLGGGMSAIFQIENGFNTNTGTLSQGGREFGRQAWVGLASQQYGKLTFGRQYDPAVDLWSSYTLAGSTMGDLGAHVYDNDNADWDNRTSNAIKYTSPTIAGFKGEIMYAFSNQTGGFADNRLYGAAGTYSMDNFSATLAYKRTDGGNSSTTGAAGTPEVFTAAKQQDLDFGMRYAFNDRSNVQFAFSHVVLNDPTANEYLTDIGTTPWNSWTFDNFELNGQYFFQPDFWISGGYALTHGSFNQANGTHSAPNWHQLSVMLDYDLSKSTSVYIQAAYQHATGKTGTGFDNATIIGSADVSDSRNQTMVRLAMTHRF